MARSMARRYTSRPCGPRDIGTASVTGTRVMVSDGSGASYGTGCRSCDAPRGVWVGGPCRGSSWVWVDRCRENPGGIYRMEASQREPSESVRRLPHAREVSRMCAKRASWVGNRTNRKARYPPGLDDDDSSITLTGVAGRHAATRFDSSSVPPCALGMTWSAVVAGLRSSGRRRRPWR